MDTACLVTLPCAMNFTLKRLTSLPILTRKSFWWWQCSGSIRYKFPLSSLPPIPYCRYHVCYPDVKLDRQQCSRGHLVPICVCTIGSNYCSWLGRILTHETSLFFHVLCGDWICAEIHPLRMGTPHWRTEWMLSGLNLLEELFKNRLCNLYVDLFGYVGLSREWVSSSPFPLLVETHQKAVWL